MMSSSSSSAAAGVDKSGGFISHRVQETRQRRKGDGGGKSTPSPIRPSAAAAAAAAAVCGFSLDFVCGPISCAMNVWLTTHGGTRASGGGRRRRSKERTEMMSAGSQSVTHSIGEEEGREGAAVWPGRLNRELVSRWILIMSPREMRREEGERRARSNREFESGARSRNLTELGAVANPTRRPAASSHFFTPLRSIIIQSRTH